MKQRALPQSFWQEPNVTNPQPPGIIFSNLPPLPLDEGGDLTPIEEVSQPTFTGNNHNAVTVSTGPIQQTVSSSVQTQAANQQQPVGAISKSVEAVLVTRKPERIISAANTDLLFSLFNSVEEEEVQKKIHVVRRGR